MKYWAVIPAAGVGSRMQASIPKQYLTIAGKTILEHTLQRFITHPHIAGVVVAISLGDEYWQDLTIPSEKPLLIAEGGAERCHSVLSSLHKLKQIADDEDWVLVHDAARPCLRHEDIDKLIHDGTDHLVGGLLAVPVKDTMKRSVNNIISKTVDRENLWHALTPQMFRLGKLTQAITNTVENKLIVTDEAQAMEQMQQMPLLVEGHPDNIKITRPDDLDLANYYLQAQENIK